MVKFLSYCEACSDQQCLWAMSLWWEYRYPQVLQTEFLPWVGRKGGALEVAQHNSIFSFYDPCSLFHEAYLVPWRTQQKVHSLLSVSHSVMADSSRFHRPQPTRLLCPWILQGRILGWVAIPFSFPLRCHLLLTFTEGSLRQAYLLSVVSEHHPPEAGARVSLHLQRPKLDSKEYLDSHCWWHLV